MKVPMRYPLFNKPWHLRRTDLPLESHWLINGFGRTSDNSSGCFSRYGREGTVRQLELASIQSDIS